MTDTQRHDVEGDAVFVAQNPVATGRDVRTPQLPVDWQHLWFSVARHPWSALGVVPAHVGVNTLDAARHMVSAGAAYSAASVQLIDATLADPDSARDVIARIEQYRHDAQRCVVALPSPITAPAAISVARVAGAILLVVPLGLAEIRIARRTIDSIGREYFLGAVSMR